jgi:hypothetical protein
MCKISDVVYVRAVRAYVWGHDFDGLTGVRTPRCWWLQITILLRCIDCEAERMLTA